MKVYMRPLNKGETFCCSIKEVKDIFKNTDVILDFAFFGRNYSTFAETADGYYLKNHIRGYVIASSYMEARRTNPIIGFYVLRNNMFTQDMKKDFSKKYLQEFYKLYEEMQTYPTLQEIAKLIIVELYEGKMILHKVIL